MNRRQRRGVSWLKGWEPENRKARRYEPRDNSALMLEPDGIISFSILDISKKGIAFSYHGSPQEARITTHTNIVFFNDDNGMIEIGGEVVSDVQIKNQELWNPFLEKKFSERSLQAV